MAGAGGRGCLPVLWTEGAARQLAGGEAGKDNSSQLWLSEGG